MARIRLPSTLPLPRLTCGLAAAGLSLVGAGCAEVGPRVLAGTPPASVVRAAPGDVTELPAVVPQTGPGCAGAPHAEAAPPRVVPINLDTVLRLAEEQNAQVGQARARVDEAYAEQDVAKNNWLPAIYVGTAFYRHEGGIQNEDGTLTHSSFGALFAGLEVNGRFDIKDVVFQRVNAERRVWQQQGELSRITSETLLDAASTYVDLLAARTGEQIALGLQNDLESLLERTEKLASKEPGARVEVYRIRAEAEGEKQVIRRLQEQAVAAAAKLAYLLGLDPCVQLVPVDERLVPFDLVNLAPPVCELVNQALATGPGVREMEGLLNLIQDSLERAKGPGKYLPTLEARMAEGAFGAGPGDSLTWDNRWDLGLQARWNLTDLLTARTKQRVAETKLEQAHLAYDDLRGKLTAGVQEAREASFSQREQIGMAQKQIDEARQAHKLSDQRLRNIPGTTAGEVLLSLQAVSTAQVNYVNALRSYDKAQLRLMILLGPGAAAACRAQPPEQQLPTAPPHGK